MASFLSEGYAAGSMDGGEWLTVWGSAYRSDLVYATPAEAMERADVLRSRSVPHVAEKVFVRRVRREGDCHYRILPEEP